MALTADFWRKDEQLDIFRSKVCTRLSRDGVCQWKSQCQFSHCCDWPKRQPSKYSYSPEVCPNIEVTVGKDGSNIFKNLCTGGRSCPYAHSMEEVLYHPLIFKTTQCEEYASLVKDTDKKKTNKHGKKRCHRYYCPFAHGEQELKKSSLDTDQIQNYLRKLDIFPSSDCCKFCVMPSRNINATTERSARNLLQASKLDPFPRPPEELLLSPILATAPQPWSNLMALRQAREQAPIKEDFSTINFSPALSSLLNPLPYASQNSPTLSPLSKASEDVGYDSLPMMKDLPPPLKIHMDGFGFASLAPIHQPTLNFTEQKEYRETKDELSARIYAML